MDGALLLIVVGAAVAGFVQGLAGFGFGLVAMAFWAWALDARLAAALAVSCGLAGQVLAALTVRRGFDAQRLLPFLAGGLLGIPLGAAALPLLDPALFKALVGAILAIWCPFMMAARRLPRITRGGRVADATVGALGGVMGGLGGFTGVVPTLWCTLRGFDKDAQRAIIQNFNLAMLAATLATYLYRGVVTAQTAPYVAIAIAAMLLPGWLGARAYLGISDAMFRKLVLGLLTAAGWAMLASSLPALWP